MTRERLFQSPCVLVLSRNQALVGEVPALYYFACIMISKEVASINESDGKTIRIIEGAAFINVLEKRFGGVVESDGL